MHCFTFESGRDSYAYLPSEERRSETDRFGMLENHPFSSPFRACKSAHALVSLYDFSFTEIYSSSISIWMPAIIAQPPIKRNWGTPRASEGQGTEQPLRFRRTPAGVRGNLGFRRCKHETILL
eukprot:612765-Pyramimonas_sp.AAC.1